MSLAKTYIIYHQKSMENVGHVVVNAVPADGLAGVLLCHMQAH